MPPAECCSRPSDDGDGALGTLAVALAPTIPVVLAGWCTAQVFFNALLAAQVAILPDQVPATQRGMVSGLLGVSLPLASVTGTYLVQAFGGNELAMFAAPCVVGGFFVVLFTTRLADRRREQADKPPWSMREVIGSFYVDPRRNPSFSWVFASRFLIVMAYAFLIATADETDGYLLGMAIGGLGFGMYMAVDLALVVEVLPDIGTAAKDLGVLNIAGALPFALAPALAPAILAIAGASYAALYTVAGACALVGAAAILPVTSTVDRGDDLP